MIIIGLGNYGNKYKNTRHNLGFLAVEELQKKNQFPAFKLIKKTESEVSEKDGIILAKPHTYMNESGRAAKKLVKNKKEEIIVIHDDIDLPSGEIKVSKNKGSAGHKGVESVIKELGTEDFTRIRIGICPEIKPEDTASFALSKIQEKEIEGLKKAVIALEEEIKKGRPEIFSGRLERKERKRPIMS